MSRPRISVLFAAAFVLVSLPSRAGAAESAALGRDAEDGFRRLIHMAESGRFGADVRSANVGIANNEVRIELLRNGEPSKVLLLRKKTSARSSSRYFDVSAGEGANAADVERIGTVLDEVFAGDPFRVPGLEESPSTAPNALPGLAEAWSYGGWRGALHALELRMTALATLRYTVAVIALLALGSLASLALLWGSLAPRSDGSGWPRVRD